MKRILAALALSAFATAAIGQTSNLGSGATSPQVSSPNVGIDSNSVANPSGVDTGGTSSVPDIGANNTVEPLVIPNDPLVVPNDPLGNDPTNNLFIDGNSGNRALSPQPVQ